MFFELSSFFVLTTILADAGETQLALRNLTAALLLHHPFQLLGNLHLGKVDDCVAAGADEVNMGRGVGIEALDSAHSTQALDDPLAFKQGQIPVDRRQGNVRMLRLEQLVKGFGGRVGVGVSQAGVLTGSEFMADS